MLIGHCLRWVVNLCGKFMGKIGLRNEYRDGRFKPCAWVGRENRQTPRGEEERKEEPARMAPADPAEEMPPEVSTNVLQIN